MKSALLLLMLLSLNSFAEDFPVEGSMQKRVDFWKKVYTEITTDEAFIHDVDDLGIIYKKVSLPSSPRERIRFAKQEKKELSDILNTIAQKNYIDLVEYEQHIANIVGKRTPQELRYLSENLRIQYGLKDRYYHGLIESYKYLDYIKKVFKDMDLPERLAYLPHVESSFNYKAHSKVGAAGIWQFMRSTARKYNLKVTYVVDERRDVIKATEAAAKFLKDNFDLLGTWPLALTAYNHGPKSIERAVSQLGTNKIHEIIERYDGRRFGFASQNFYATYMATVQISEDPDKYFPSFERPPKFNYSVFKLDREYTIAQIIKNLKVSKEVLQNYNPSIRPIAFQGRFPLPRNFNLHIPETPKEEIVKIQDIFKSTKESPVDLSGEKFHIIASGENLYDISKMYNVSLNDLVSLNQITRPSRIYAGMKLFIPEKNNKSTIPIVVTQNKPLENKPKEPIIVQTPSVVPTLTASLETEAISSSEKPDITLENYAFDVTPLSENLYQITIETEETIGHLADWAKTNAQKIRTLNQLGSNSIVDIGQKIKINILKENLEEFNRQRNQYHMAIQEDFFNDFQIIGKKEYKVVKGDNLTAILKKHDLPYWLVRNSQPSGKLSGKITIGQIIIIPEISSKGGQNQPPLSQE